MMKSRIRAGGYLSNMQDVHVLCIGDMMLDTFVYGNVERISPEAPVAVLRWNDEKTMLGGVGNVVANLVSLGVRTSLICRVGDDAAGKRIRELLDGMGVEVRTSTVPDLPTTEKTRFISKNNHLMRMDRERVVEPDATELETVVAFAGDMLDDVSLVILSDYGKGFLSRDLLTRVIRACRERAIPVFVDPKGLDYSKYAGATLIKPNRKELGMALGEEVVLGDDASLAAVIEQVRRLCNLADVDEVLVTLSENGMVYASRDPQIAPVRLPTKAREVCDVSGAGDTTIAVLAAARAAGAGMPEAMALANAAAGIVVGKVGTATVTQEELQRAIEGGGIYPTRIEKVLSMSELVSRVANWKSVGEVVGFTNGCFDCLHLGHLSSLRQAREHCSKLVVAVNTDRSVRRLKGESRPLQDEQTRSQVLAELDLVDAVVLFDEPTALEVVKRICPDVIAKEGYALENWPEAQFVASHGGKAVTLRREDGYSTSGLVARLKNTGGKR